ncbi:hypothetical protein M3Y96_01043100 [Aphelenchoides besseyi]|nr:hypothetical protein M3Y96_01043100 [Aphelenchoides besseyi]
MLSNRFCFFVPLVLLLIMSNVIAAELMIDDGPADFGCFDTATNCEELVGYCNHPDKIIVARRACRLTCQFC